MSMNPNQLHRLAYVAAHALMSTDTSHPKYACEGTRRSKAVDTIADTIIRVFQMVEEVNTK